MCPHESIDSKHELVLAPPVFRMAPSVYIIQDGRCREHVPAALYAEVKEIPSERSEMATPLFLQMNRWFRAKVIPGSLQPTQMAEQ